MRLLITLFLFLTNASSAFATLETKGYRLPIEIMSKHHFLMNKDPSLTLIKKYIMDNNLKIKNEEARLMSGHIIHIAHCLEIDPWILTGLIKAESSFDRNAESKTGAVGLTQFTNIGLKEVNDQLGLRGREGAPMETILFLSERIRNCIAPDWVDVWNRIDARLEDPDFYKQLKLLFKKDIQVSIVYGAVLLKTYLGIIYKKNAPRLQASELYFQALQFYNGEEGQAKVKFAKNVFLNLKALYPAPVHFPFLD